VKSRYISDDIIRNDQYVQRMILTWLKINSHCDRKEEEGNQRQYENNCYLVSNARWIRNKPLLIDKQMLIVYSNVFIASYRNNDAIETSLFLDQKESLDFNSKSIISM
jgi:hypothetical protein